MTQWAIATGKKPGGSVNNRGCARRRPFTAASKKNGESAVEA
jgi:hypothetical protein